MSYIDRIRNIEYQLLKNLSFTPTDEQIVNMTNSILKAQLTLAENDGEDITDTSLNPTSFLGASVTWDTSNPEGDSYTIELGSFSITQDADDPIGMIINTADGINDAEAVALDKADLTIGLGTNSDLQNVESDLTFPTSGSNGTTITWDAAANSAVDNSGVVTQDSGDDVTGNIVATISKGAESDTKTFGVTVLQGGAAGTEFISTWQTDASADGLWVGTSSNQVKFPLAPEGTYDFTIDWGDGTQDTITAYDQPEVTHTYSTAGTYDITVDGQCEGWGFTWGDFTTGDQVKLIGVKQWGNMKIHPGYGGIGRQFAYTIHFTSITAPDALDVSHVTNFDEGFGLCGAIGEFSNIENWDVSNVTNMNSMFEMQEGFDPQLPDPFDLSGWCVSNIPSRPSNFGNFNGTTQLEPVWGTCPGSNNPPNNITGVLEDGTEITDYYTDTPEIFDIRSYYIHSKTWTLVVDNDSGILDPDGDAVTFKSNVTFGSGGYSAFTFDENAGTIDFTADGSTYDFTADFWTEDSNGATSDPFTIRFLLFVS